MSEPRFEYEPFPDLDLPLAARLGQYPRQPDLLLDTARALGRRVAAAALRLQFRFEVVGAAPDLPRVAIMPNHQSHLDTLAILAALPERDRRRVTVLAARDYFFEHPAPAALANLLGRPSPSTVSSELAELHRWARLLPTVETGWFLIYPSGSRKRLEPHAGLAGVLARSGWTVLPTALAGTAERVAGRVGAVAAVPTHPRHLRRAHLRRDEPDLPARAAGVLDDARHVADQAASGSQPSEMRHGS